MEVKVGMKANFSFLYPGDHRDPEMDADEHALWLAKYESSILPSIRPTHPNDSLPTKFLFKKYYCVDVLGKEFVWMNNSFPKDQYKWYLWYESVFLVPEEMATFLTLRWS